MDSWPKQPIHVHRDGSVGDSHYKGFTFEFERNFDVYPTICECNSEL